MKYDDGILLNFYFVISRPVLSMVVKMSYVVLTHPVTLCLLFTVIVVHNVFVLIKSEFDCMVSGFYSRVGNAGAKKDGVSIDQILSHLDHMRQVCKNISCKI